MSRPEYYWPERPGAVDWSLVPDDDPPTVVLPPLAGPGVYPNASYYHAGRWLWWVYLTDLDPGTGAKTTRSVATTWTRAGAGRKASRALARHKRRSGQANLPEVK